VSLELILFLIIGLVVGSFLGVVTRRLPRKESFISGRSHCPTCSATINWYDNIPLLSFLVLRGRCRNCHKRISIRYPLIELATGLGVLGIYILNWQFPIFFIIILLITISVFVIDFEKKIIPDELIFLGLGVTSVALLLGWNDSFYLHFFGGFASALFLLVVHLITRGRGMGLGDVKYALFPGTVLGWPQSIVWLFISFLTGAGVGVILILLGKAKLGRHIAFGPFLAASFLVTLVFGNVLLKWLIG